MTRETNKINTILIFTLNIILFINLTLDLTIAIIHATNSLSHYVILDIFNLLLNVFLFYATKKGYSLCCIVIIFNSFSHVLLLLTGIMPLMKSNTALIRYTLALIYTFILISLIYIYCKKLLKILKDFNNYLLKYKIYLKDRYHETFILDKELTNYPIYVFKTENGLSITITIKDSMIVDNYLEKTLEVSLNEFLKNAFLPENSHSQLKIESKGGSYLFSEVSHMSDITYKDFYLRLIKAQMDIKLDYILDIKDDDNFLERSDEELIKLFDCLVKNKLLFTTMDIYLVNPNNPDSIDYSKSIINDLKYHDMKKILQNNDLKNINDKLLEYHNDLSIIEESL